MIIFSILIRPTYSATTESKTVTPIVDAHVSSVEEWEDSNFGGKSFLEISNAENMFVGKKIAYLMFDLSYIPTDATLESAVLQLCCAELTETHTIGIHYCSNNDWKENEITWKNKPSYEKSVISTQRVSKGSNTWYNWTVTNAARTAVGNKKISLVVKSETRHKTAWLYFASRDQEYSWMKEYRPRLILEYTKPVEESVGEISGFPLESLVTGIITASYLIIRRRLAKKN